MLIPGRRTARRTLLAAGRSLTFGAAIGASARAAASEPREPPPTDRLELEYHADAVCPPAARFQAEVQARLARPLLWDVPEATKQLRVRLERKAQGFRAALSVQTGTDAASTREFETEACEDALVAVALVAALSIDPAASIAPGSALPAAEQTTPALPAIPPPAVQPARPAPRRAATPRRPPPAPVQDSPAEAAETSGSPSTGAVDVGASVSLTWGPAPTALVLGGIRVGVADRAERWIAPRFELSALIGRTGVVGATADLGTFTTIVARASLCPIRVPAAGPLFVQPCATLDTGWIIARGDGENIAPRTEGRLHLASGPSVQATASVDRWIVTLTLGALATITQNSYVFQNPRVVVHEADLIAPLLQASAGVVW